MSFNYYAYKERTRQKIGIKIKYIGAFTMSAQNTKIQVQVCFNLLFMPWRKCNCIIARHCEIKSNEMMRKVSTVRSYFIIFETIYYYSIYQYLHFLFTVFNLISISFINITCFVIFIHFFLFSFYFISALVILVSQLKYVHHILYFILFISFLFWLR